MKWKENMDIEFETMEVIDQNCGISKVKKTMQRLEARLIEINMVSRKEDLKLKSFERSSGKEHRQEKRRSSTRSQRKDAGPTKIEYERKIQRTTGDLS